MDKGRLKTDKIPLTLTLSLGKGEG